MDKKKNNIRNPEKWVGKKVHHLANWRDFMWHEQYCVCAWTGKLIRLEDEYGPTEQEAEILRNSPLSFYYDPAHYYSEAGIADLVRRATRMIGAAA
jgi:hypothetical protein